MNPYYPIEYKFLSIRAQETLNRFFNDADDCKDVLTHFAVITRKDGIYTIYPVVETLDGTILNYYSGEKKYDNTSRNKDENL